MDLALSAIDLCKISRNSSHSVLVTCLLIQKSFVLMSATQKAESLELARAPRLQGQLSCVLTKAVLCVPVVAVTSTPSCEFFICLSLQTDCDYLIARTEFFVCLFVFVLGFVLVPVNSTVHTASARMFIYYVN